MQLWDQIAAHSSRNIVLIFNQDQRTKPDRRQHLLKGADCTLGDTMRPFPIIRICPRHALQDYFLRWEGKKNTHYFPSWGRERKLMKTQISVQMCSFDMRNRNRSLCAERIKTWAVSWLGLCTPIGVWNDLHLHKVHAQAHARTQSEQHAVLLHKFTTRLGRKKIIT